MPPEAERQAERVLLLTLSLESAVREGKSEEMLDLIRARGEAIEALSPMPLPPVAIRLLEQARDAETRVLESIASEQAHVVRQLARGKQDTERARRFTNTPEPVSGNLL